MGKFNDNQNDNQKEEIGQLIEDGFTQQQSGKEPELSLQQQEQQTQKQITHPVRIHPVHIINDNE